MTLRAIVVDDEPLGRRGIVSRLTGWDTVKLTVDDVPRTKPRRSRMSTKKSSLIPFLGTLRQSPRKPYYSPSAGQIVSANRFERCNNSLTAGGGHALRRGKTFAENAAIREGSGIGT